MVISTIVTVVGLIFGLIVNKRDVKLQGNIDTIVKDIIPVSGIILALLSPIVTALSSPVLDYTVSGENKQKNISVTINNYGFTTAKGIQVYFTLPDQVLSKFSSNPFINGTKYRNSEDIGKGTGLFYIPALPPRSETTITANINSSLTSSDIATIYVRSETSTGLHGVISLSQAYIAYTIALIFNALLIISKKWVLSRDSIIGLAIFDFAASVLIGGILFYGACESNASCLSTGINITYGGNLPYSFNIK